MDQSVYKISRAQNKSKNNHVQNLLQFANNATVLYKSYEQEMFIL